MKRSRDDVKMALVMLIGVITGTEGKNLGEEGAWVDHACNVECPDPEHACSLERGRGNVDDCAVVGKRSTGTGPRKIVGHKRCRLMNRTTPNIVYQLHQRTGELHKRNDSPQRRLDTS